MKGSYLRQLNKSIRARLTAMITLVSCSALVLASTAFIALGQVRVRAGMLSRGAV